MENDTSNKDVASVRLLGGNGYMIMESILFTKSMINCKFSSLLLLSSNQKKELKKVPIDKPCKPGSTGSFGFLKKTTCSLSEMVRDLGKDLARDVVELPPQSISIFPSSHRQ
jgi:hypothetical protein